MNLQMFMKDIQLYNGSQKVLKGQDMKYIQCLLGCTPNIPMRN